jgi:acyl-CoA hydrolase
MTARTPAQSLITTTELVLPNDTNTLTNMMGGRMMHIMDIAAAMAAQKHCNRVVVTASVDSITFKVPIKLGAAVTVQAKVSRAFASSMEVYIIAHCHDLLTQESVLSHEAFFTFVAVDQIGRPIDVPAVQPETEEEHKLYNGALRRRQLRLILAGRMKPEDATELKSIFDIKEVIKPA